MLQARTLAVSNGAGRSLRRAGVAEARNEYTYSAGGKKLKVINRWASSYSSSPVIGSAVNTESLNVTKTTDYIGNFVYENGVLKRILTENGYYENNNYYFYVRNHLGSNAIVADINGNIVQQNHFYPFGQTMAISTGQGAQPYKFTGKELDLENGLNLYDFEARTYDPSVGRFTSVDLAAEKYYSISPYAYCFNNPFRLIDPDGKKPTALEAAYIARHVYSGSGELTGGWRVSSDNFNVTNLNNNITGLKSNVYERVVDGEVTEYVYATAGTDMGDGFVEGAKDWEQNALQLAGLSGQYKMSADNARRISYALGETELTFVGHSLGGGEAALNALVTDRAAITFNAAGVSTLTKLRNGGIKTLFKSESKITAYVMKTDPLNLIQNGNDPLGLGHSLPDVNGTLIILNPVDVQSYLNGHSLESLIKSLIDEFF
ncbi:MAG: hypothetical protein LBR64_03440 [Dysgonamonadaceae bacterium]|nr:hypothetical protein [Dysgonamonadaceae bacterium]